MERGARGAYEIMALSPKRGRLSLAELLQSRDRRNVITRLEQERTRRGLTLREAAQRAGVSYSLLNRWERRENVPRADHALKVARAFGLTFDDLVHDFE